MGGEWSGEEGRVRKRTEGEGKEKKRKIGCPKS
jgi:hypothetical protein